MKFKYLFSIFIFAQIFCSCKDAPSPSIESVEPAFGPAETLVTFKGMNLEEIETLSFSGQVVNFNNAYNSENALLFRIPTNIPLGDHEVVITTAGGSASTNFRITLEPPEIFKVTPEFASEGDVITITGKNFFAPMEVLFFDSVAATQINIITPDSMEAIVPGGIEKGRIIVKADGGRAISPKNFFSVKVILVNDFDGNGVRSQTSSWLREGFIDQSNIAAGIQNANPDPINENFLKISGTDGLGISWIGGASNNSADVMDFPNFGITTTAGSTLLELDVNNNGRNNTHVLFVLLERDGSTNDFTHTIPLNNSGWKKLSIPLNRFEDLDGSIVDPAKIKTLKIHLIDEDDSDTPLEVNLDNIKFIEVI